MDLTMFIYAMICIGFGAMMIEDITRNGLRWSIADLLKLTLAASAMLALGRILALA